MTGQWLDVTDAAGVPRGEMVAAVVSGRAIVVCHTSAGWFAADNTCSHSEARLHEGYLRGCRLVCPLHGAAFDLRDGRPLGPPAVKPIAIHRVRVNAGRIEVALGA